jgi:hypothetical protein
MHEQAVATTGRRNMQQQDCGFRSATNAAWPEEEEDVLADATGSHDGLPGWQQQQQQGAAAPHEQQTGAQHAQWQPTAQQHLQQDLIIEQQQQRAGDLKGSTSDWGSYFTTAAGAAATAPGSGMTGNTNSSARAKWQTPVSSSSNISSSSHSRWASNRQPLQVLPNNEVPRQPQHASAAGMDQAAAAAGIAAPAGGAPDGKQAAGLKRPGGFVVPRPAASINTDSRQQQQQQHISSVGPAGAGMLWQHQGAVQQQQQQGFVFPPPGSSLPLRRVAIPTSFQTAAAYKAALLAAMTEEVGEVFGNHLLYECSCRQHAAHGHD